MRVITPSIVKLANISNSTTTQWSKHRRVLSIRSLFFGQSLKLLGSMIIPLFINLALHYYTYLAPLTGDAVMIWCCHRIFWQSDECACIMRVLVYLYSMHQHIHKMAFKVFSVNEVDTVHENMTEYEKMTQDSCLCTNCTRCVFQFLGATRTGTLIHLWPSHKPSNVKPSPCV